MLTAEPRDNVLMGIALWVVAGLAAFSFARIVPVGRKTGIFGELLVSIAAATLLGVAATALDFGGWNEPDWRAGLFAFLGAAAAAGVARLVGGPKLKIEN